MISTIGNVLYYIDMTGFYGPFILAFINIYMLWERKIYLIWYMTFSVFNTLANGVLKTILREPRPNGQIYLNDLDIVPTSGPSKYGMPSGHAQSVGYSITFLYLVIHSPMMLYITTFIGVLTIYQRYVYRRHTLTQLLIGFGVGSAFAMISYEVAKYYVTQPEIKMFS